jgi:hypothetical protein
MSFIQMTGSFSSVQEKQPVPDGTYDLVIESAEAGNSKSSGKPQIHVVLGIEGHDDAPKVQHYISLPAQDDTPDKLGTKMLMLKRFLEAFGIPYEDTGFAVEDFFGAKGSARLTLTSPDDEGSNGIVYNRLQLPRLADESKPALKAVGKKS